MSKHHIEGGGHGEFWKKMKYGAMTAITVGSGIYAAASVLNKRGVISDVVEGVRVAIQSPPSTQNSTTEGIGEATTHNMEPGQMPPTTLLTDKMPPSDREEARTVLEMQLQFAMQSQNTPRVQELSRQLDMLDHLDAQRSCDGPLGLTSSMGTEPNNPARTSGMHASAHDVSVHNVVQAHDEGSKPVGVQPPTQKPMSPPISMRQLRRRSMDPPMHPSMSTGVHETADGGTKKTLAPTAATHREPSPRQAAMANLQVGDIVEALDPTTSAWCPAAIHAMAKNGLVEVRWFDPGCDEHGKPFHPIGEVWADQIRVKRHTPVLGTPHSTVTGAASGHGANAEAAITLPDGLQIGDDCYAMGKVIESNWFRAKLLGARARSPSLRVEYMATLDGQTVGFLLPSSRKDYVRVDQLRRDKPEVVEPPVLVRRENPEAAAPPTAEAAAPPTAETAAPPTAEATAPPTAEAAAPQTLRNDNDENVAKGGTKGGVAVNDNNKAEGGGDEDDVVITPDLMCTVCERPDDEAKMLVCDCKAGYHIYCLKPPLDAVPEDDWLCPSCMKSKH